jgi:hypothetical protein
MDILDENYISGLVEQANRIALARKWVDDADLVIGVFNDHEEPYGVGLHIIKGQRLITTVVAEQSLKSDIRQLCLPCNCLEEAIAIQRELGEPDPTH